MELDPALARLSALGGFFALRTGRTPDVPPPALHRAYLPPVPGAAGTDPLDRRVRTVAARLGVTEARVAASVAQQGLAARLWSVALGAAALYGRVPDLDPRLLRWDPDAAAPDDLWLTAVRALPGDAATLHEVVEVGHLRPLAAALRARHPVAEGLLRGNAASALASTARLLGQWARVHDRPDAGERARALAADLLSRPGLRDAGTLRGTAYRRRSCCLYYRVPGGGVCGDCCFPYPPGRS
ncbi:(2Fe-2S)-binding protein [Streptomyces minutiscleroticus]|nr:(2Fe-2S)-binding protein [Streptomyces minutiscleroticus]